ncbi:hypothetical protein [Methylocystis sp. S23]
MSAVDAITTTAIASFKTVADFAKWLLEVVAANPRGAILFVVAFGSGATFLKVLFWPQSPGGFGEVAFLILLGLGAFLGIMAQLGLSAKNLGIVDARQPFGLPDGSVRAILTMAFIVLVGVLASYLVTGTDGRKAFLDNPIPLAVGVPLTVAERYQRDHAADGVITIGPSGKVKDGSSDAYDVGILPRVDHRLGDDVSKQILTMLSTILAAMIGFYFGSTPAGTFDPAIVKRSDYSSRITDLLSRAPSVDSLRETMEKLKDQMTPEEAASATRFTERLGELRKAIDAARDAQNSQSTSSDEMQSAAIALDSAAAELAAINVFAKQILDRVSKTA